ncbi:MAG TPA: hypothetical protein VJT75_08840 [Thermoleophilaceae bacterium]|nr:hypothetical protein [Thermoleophilaceae bacterium]
MAGDVAYHGFISYSHAVDGRLAPALQKALQRFAKPWYRQRALRIFRDEASLSANPGLWPSIAEALDRSQHFILLASPEGARSKWVAREAEHWRQSKPGGALLIALTDGDLAWDPDAGDFDWDRTTALPATLEGAFDEEPRWVDLRFAGRIEHLSLSHAEWRDAVAELAAPLHGRPKDEIAGEEVRQHRRTVRIARAAAAALTTLTLAAIVLGLVALRQRDEAVDQKHTASSRAFSASALLNLPRDPELSLQLAAEAQRESPTDQSRQALQLALRDSYVRATMSERRGGVAAAHYSGDGRFIATAGREGAIRLWRGDGRARVSAMRQPAEVRDLAVNHDATMLATAGDDGVLRVWRARSGRLAWAASAHRGGVAEVEFGARDGRLLSRGVEDGLVRLWRAGERTPIATLRHPSVAHARFSGDGGVVMTGSPTRTRLWSATTGRPLGSVAYSVGVGVHADPPPSAVSTDGELVYTPDGAIRRRRDGRRTAAIPTGTVPITSAEFSPDGRLLARTDLGGRAEVWNARTGGRVASVRVSSEAARSVRFDQSGGFVLTAGDDGTASIFDARSGRLLQVFRGHSAQVSGAEFGPGATRVLSASEDGTARVWEAFPGRPRWVAPIGEPGVSWALSPDGQTAAFEDDQGTVTAWATVPPRRIGSTGEGLAIGPADDEFPRPGRLLLGDVVKSPLVWDPRSGRKEPDATERAVARLPLGADVTTDLSRDRRRVLIPDGESGGARVWDVGTRKRLLDLKGVGAPSLSPDGRYVAATIDDNRNVPENVLGIWSVDGGRRTARVSLVGTFAIADAQFVFAPTGPWLVTNTGASGVIQVWDRRSGALVSQIRAGHSGPIAVSEDGEAIALGHAFGGRRQDPLVQVWSPRGALLGRFAGNPNDYVQQVALSPDGRFVQAIVTGQSRNGSQQQRLVVFPCDACGSGTRLAALAEKRVTRHLSESQLFDAGFAVAGGG